MSIRASKRTLAVLVVGAFLSAQATSGVGVFLCLQSDGKAAIEWLCQCPLESAGRGPAGLRADAPGRSAPLAADCIDIPISSIGNSSFPGDRLESADPSTDFLLAARLIGRSDGTDALALVSRAIPISPKPSGFSTTTVLLI